MERAPARIAPWMLAPAAGHPDRGRLGIREELLVAQAVLVGERRQRPAQFHERPEQQLLGLLAVVPEGGLFVGKAREPRADRLQIVRRGDLRLAVRRAVRA